MPGLAEVLGEAFSATGEGLADTGEGLVCTGGEVTGTFGRLAVDIAAGEGGVALVDCVVFAGIVVLPAPGDRLSGFAELPCLSRPAASVHNTDSAQMLVAVC